MRLFIEDFSIWDHQTEARWFNGATDDVCSLTFEFDSVSGLITAGKALSENVLALTQRTHVEGQLNVGVVGNFRSGKSTSARATAHAFRDVVKTEGGRKIFPAVNREFLSANSTNLGRIIWADINAERHVRHLSTQKDAQAASLLKREAIKSAELLDARERDGFIVLEHADLQTRKGGFAGFDIVFFINDDLDRSKKILTLIVGKNAPLRPQIENLGQVLEPYVVECARNVLPPPQPLI